MKLSQSALVALTLLGLSACSDALDGVYKIPDAPSKSTESNQALCKQSGENKSVGDVLYTSLKSKGRIECKTANVSRVCD